MGSRVQPVGLLALRGLDPALNRALRTTAALSLWQGGRRRSETRDTPQRSTVELSSDHWGIGTLRNRSGHPQNRFLVRARDHIRRQRRFKRTATGYR